MGVSLKRHLYICTNLYILYCMEITTKSANKTIALGKKFAGTLKGGEVVLLIGELGSGKTTFVKGVAQGLGIKKNITSPTFVLMKVYSTVISSDSRLNPSFRERRGKSRNLISKPKQIPRLRYAPLGMIVRRLVHIDTYRGLNLADLENIGALEYFGQKDTACFVEWGARLEKYLKQKSIACIKINIKILSESKRRFEIKNE